MKTIQKIKFLSFLLLGLIVSSCVQDDDFQTPNVSYEEPDIDEDQIIDVTAAIAYYGGYEPVQITAGEDADEPVYLEGYVVSSDESGNFYKTLIIQDKPENPTAGIAISTEANDLYTSYEPGRKIYLRVDGLYSGEYANLPTIGVQNDDEVGRIGEIDFYNRIERTGIVEELVPTLVTIENLENAPLNTLIKLEGVQFPDELNGATYASEGYTEDRIVENCDEDEVILRNSGYSDFWSKLLPEGNGSLVAVLSLYGSTTQLFIRDEDDVMFDGERCSDEPVGPVDPTEPGLIDPPLNEGFEGGTAYENIDLEGWSNINVNGGENLFQFRSFGSNMYAQTSGYNSDEDPYETWLVTPGVDLASVSSATLSFETKDGYYNGTALTAFISTDFDGDVTSANWTEITGVTYSTGNTDGYGDEFVPSGDVDLSAYAGQIVYIAFRYLGADGGITTTYQIDNVSLTAN